MTGLCERLRRSVTDTTAFCPKPEYRNPDGPDAADRIEALEAALREAREFAKRLILDHGDSPASDPLIQRLDALLSDPTQ